MVTVQRATMMALVRRVTTTATTTMVTTMTMTMVTARWAMERRDMITTTMTMGDDDDGNGATGDKVKDDSGGTMGDDNDDNGDGKATGDSATGYDDDDYG